MKIQNLAELLGKRVVVTADAGTLGYFVADRHLDARRIGAVGVVQQAVPGHGGDVVSVLHEDVPDGDDPVAVYCHYTSEVEFESPEAVEFANKKAAELRRLEARRRRLIASLDDQIAQLRAKKFEGATHAPNRPTEALQQPPKTTE